MIRILLGIILLSAAVLKIYGWSVTTVPPVGWFSTPGVQGAAIGWEILLGAWLLCGVSPLGSRLTAIGTFTLLAGISGYLGWIGQATCDCFGTIKASPWHALTVDVIALGLLFLARPRWEPSKAAQDGESWTRAISLLRGALGVGMIVALLAAIGTGIYGSPLGALARLRGESLTIKPDYVDFGVGQPGAKLEAEVTVQNWTDHAVRLIGGTSECSCVASTGLPITIPARESRIVPLRLRVPTTSNGAFTRKAVLRTDEDSQRTVILYLGCRIQSAGSGSQPE